jgi:crotonobetainyl-CoA:carnitine CoA-transferase CaiB-like acyl-CoA transferase
MTVRLPHPLAGEVELVASPMKFSATPVRYRNAPPLLGQHTVQVLGELGLESHEIDALRRSGAI